MVPKNQTPRDVSIGVLMLLQPPPIFGPPPGTWAHPAGMPLNTTNWTGIPWELFRCACMTMT